MSSWVVKNLSTERENFSSLGFVQRSSKASIVWHIHVSRKPKASINFTFLLKEDEFLISFKVTCECGRKIVVWNVKWENFEKLFDCRNFFFFDSLKNFSFFDCRNLYNKIKFLFLVDSRNLYNIKNFYSFDCRNSILMENLEKNFSCSVDCEKFWF